MIEANTSGSRNGLDMPTARQSYRDSGRNKLSKDYINLLKKLGEEESSQASFLDLLSRSLYVFPHEFLSLACNVKRRTDLM
jgi:hypothetical protein